MAKSLFRHAKVAGISVVVPPHEIRLEDELQYFDGNPKKAARMTRMVGIDRRRVAAPGVTTADMCQQAAETLFAEMEFDRSAIDAIIFISQSPDYFIPATACILQDKLGLSKNVAAFDVNQGCTAYTYGLWLASSLIESGAARNVLFLVGESSGWTMDPDNRIVTPVFGDAGAACLMSYCEEERPAWFLLGTDGSGHEAIIRPAGHSRLQLPLDKEEYAELCRPIIGKGNVPWRLVRTYMDGGTVYDFTVNVVPDHIRELLEYAQTDQDGIDFLVLHQANKQIIQTVAERAGFPLEKAPWETFSRYGNQAGASIPGAICDVLQEEVSTKKLRVLLSGYGIGLSWTSCVMELDHIWCSGVRDYAMPPGHPSPAEVLEYWTRKLGGETE